MTTPTPPTPDHAFVHDNLAAYLAGGLDPAERARFDAHINACPLCFDAFSEARDADRALQRTLGTLAPNPQFEDHLVTHIREHTMNHYQHPMVRRAVYAAAACVALAATGVFANIAMRQSGRFSNPLTRDLAADADAESSDLAKRNLTLTKLFSRHSPAPTEDLKDQGMPNSYYAGDKPMSRPGISQTNTMTFHFENTPVDSILADMSAHFGFIVVKSVTIPQRVTITVPNPVHADEAVNLLNDALSQIGYGLLETYTGTGPDAKTTVRIAGIAEVKKANVPVLEGGDPDKIPMTDQIITQVIPLKNVDAARLKSDLSPLMSADADSSDITVNAAANTIVVTDTSAKVHRLAEIVQKMDNQRSSKSVIEYRQLTNGNAADAAKTINGMFNPTSQPGGATGLGGAFVQLPQPNGTTGRGGGGAQLGRLYADADARTNTVVLNGPPDQVAQAVDALNRMQTIPADLAQKYNDVYKAKAQSDASYAAAEKSVHDLKGSIATTPNSTNDLYAAVSNGDFSGKKYREIADPSSLKDNDGKAQRSSEGWSQGSFDTLLAPSEGAAYARDGEEGKPTHSAAQPGSIQQQAKSLGDLAAAARPPQSIGATFAYNSRVSDDTNSESGNGKLRGDAGDNKWVYNSGAATYATTNGNAVNFNGGNLVANGGGNVSVPGLVAGTLVVNGGTLTASARTVHGNGDSPAYAFSGPSTPVATGLATITGGGGTGAKGVASLNADGTAAGIHEDSAADDELSVRSRRTVNTENTGGLTKSGASTLTVSDPASGLVGGTTLESRTDLGGHSTAVGDGVTVNGTSSRFAASFPLDTAAKTEDQKSYFSYQKTPGLQFDIPGQRDTLDHTSWSNNGTSTNGQSVGFADGHSEFDRQANHYRISDLLAFQDATATAPAFDLHALASESSPDATRIVAALTPPTATAPAGNSASRPSQPNPASEIAQLKIIRNGTVEFEVVSFDATYRTVYRLVSEDGGFISSTSSEKLANGRVRGTIVVRVPPGNPLDHFLAGIRGLGNLKAQQIGAADVTKQYYDIDSELRGLTTMETRLLDLIKNGKGEVKDLIEAEKQLGETRVKIEKLKGEISYYNNLVSLATITITAFEKDIQSPTSASVMENIVANIQTEQVETQYTAARKIFDDAKSRIVESQLKHTDADHVAAHIVADVPPAQADFVANQLKQLGVVASFNRDRKQTTAGGTGTPIPGVQVEQKDTRFTLELFNLANLNPRETTVLRIAVRDVESAYKNTLSLIKQPPAVPAPAPAAGAEAPESALLSGRVTSSNLTGQVPEQMAASINGELRAADADAIVAAVRASGEVITAQLNTNQDTANTTSAKRGIQITLVNIASVSPKEADAVTLAVPDVDAAYKAALAIIRKEAPAGTGASATLLTPTNGRIVSSNESGQPADATANIQAEIRADQSASILDAIRGSGEVLSATVTENPDLYNFTRLKRGLAVRFVSSASITARETRDLKARAEDVADAYRKLLDSLQMLAARNAGPAALAGAGGDVRIIDSTLSDADPRNTGARFLFDARRSAIPDIEKAFVAAGIEFPATTVVRNPDTANTLDSKVRFQISSLLPAETMDPKRTITLGLEVDNVNTAIYRLRTAVSTLKGVHESDYSISRDPYGRQIAHITLDAVVSASETVRADINGLDGIIKSTQETPNPQAPETRSFTKNRFDLTFSSRAAIVSANQGLLSSVRAALTNVVAALLFSLNLVLTGLLFILPFVIIVWPLWHLLKRRKPVKA